MKMFRRKESAQEPPVELEYGGLPGNDSTWTELSYWFPNAALVSGEVRGAACTRCRAEIRGMPWSLVGGEVFVRPRKVCAKCEAKA
jgi:hypothetical protein